MTGTSSDTEEMVWVHQHMDLSVRSLPYWTDGDGYDCPKERGCWQLVPAEEAAWLKSL